MVALQLGRADVIDVPAESMRQASQQGMRLVASLPVELVAIVFSADTDARVRDAVSLAVDRTAIFNVLLGRQGEPTAALLPNWLSGYGFLFDASQNVTHARQLAVESGRARPLTLAYDVLDPLGRAIAERIALDARAAGLVISATVNSMNPDARLVRIPLSAENPQAALASVAVTLGAAAPETSAAPEELYQAERSLRDSLHVVPLLHLPVAYGVAPRVKSWTPQRSGAWSLADVWMEDTTPKGQKP
jgi:peptide/nickel transport system substrate-binding protein